jgi:hypothetical protein
MRWAIVALVLAAGLANATFATPTQAGRVRHGATSSAPGAEGVHIHRRGRGARLRAPGAERIVIHRHNGGHRVVRHEHPAKQGR